MSSARDSWLLEGRGLGVMLGRCHILHQVDFRLARGEVVGLIGPNGAGKTTLLRTLAHLLRPGEGRLDLEGRPLASLSPRERARRLGYLAQGTPVHWPLSVAALVDLGRTAHRSWWQPPGEADAVAVQRAMAQTGVTHLAARRVDTLSGGERLRAMLARVLAAGPELILADEPVAALDPYHQLQVMELLRRQARQGGVVVVLHDLALAARYCDRLVLLQGGRVVAEGSAGQVLSADQLQSVYGIEGRWLHSDGEAAVLPWRRLR